MKASELRIGNYIQVPFGDEEPWVRSVDTIYYDSIMTENGRHCFEHEFDFVPLTEEWLVKFGFFINHYESSIEERTVYQSPEHGITLFKEDNIWYAYSLDVHIKSVHQLQNLYFALTGQELEPK